MIIEKSHIYRKTIKKLGSKKANSLNKYEKIKFMPEIDKVDRKTLDYRSTSS